MLAILTPFTAASPDHTHGPSRTSAFFRLPILYSLEDTISFDTRLLAEHPPHGIDRGASLIYLRVLISITTP
jgi:hypothetical protein